MNVADRASHLSQQTASERHVVLSIVSHGQLGLIRNLLRDVRTLDLTNATIVLTINIPEDESCLEQFADLPIIVIRNQRPKGFGDNHNQAFTRVECEFFVVVNPDIRLPRFSMDALLAPLEDPAIGAVAPCVLAPNGQVEDSVRRYPTLGRLFRRVVLRQREPEYRWKSGLLDVDWAAGMFVVFRRSAFRKIGGFDTRYFMYMEDADVCRRLKLSGWKTVLQPATSVVHDAQRASRRSLKHLRWHLASALRFILLAPSKSE